MKEFKCSKMLVGVSLMVLLTYLNMNAKTELFEHQNHYPINL